MLVGDEVVGRGKVARVVHWLVKSLKYLLIRGEVATTNGGGDAIGGRGRFVLGSFVPKILYL